MKTRNCDNCGKVYSYKRDSSKYCSNGCRTMRYKLEHGIPMPVFFVNSENKLHIKDINANINRVSAEIIRLDTQYSALSNKLSELLDLIRFWSAVKEIIMDEYHVKKDSPLKKEKIIHDCTLSINKHIPVILQRYNAEEIITLFDISKEYLQHYQNPTYREYNDKLSITTKYKDGMIAKQTYLDIVVEDIHQLTMRYEAMNTRRNNILSERREYEVVLDNYKDELNKLQSNRTNNTNITTGQSLLTHNYPSIKLPSILQNIFDCDKISTDAYIMYYGSKSCGKSTTALLTMLELMMQRDYEDDKYMYYSIEEGVRETFRLKLEWVLHNYPYLRNVANKLNISSDMNRTQLLKDMKKRCVVVIDSLTSSLMSSTDIMDLRKSCNIMVIAVNHITRTGHIKGGTLHEHDPDVMIRYEHNNGEFTHFVEKNRFQTVIRQ